MTGRFGKSDRLFLGILGLALLLGLAVFSLVNTKQGAYAKVTVDGELYGTYPLSKEQTVEIVIGGTVTNVLVIRDGKADMTEADCPDQLCVHQKAVSREKETIVCLPNKVVVEIFGPEVSGLDAVT